MIKIVKHWDSSFDFRASSSEIVQYTQIECWVFSSGLIFKGDCGWYYCVWVVVLVVGWFSTCMPKLEFRLNYAFCVPLGQPRPSQYFVYCHQCSVVQCCDDMLVCCVAAPLPASWDAGLGCRTEQSRVWGYRSSPVLQRSLQSWCGSSRRKEGISVSDVKLQVNFASISH